MWPSSSSVLTEVAEQHREEDDPMGRAQQCDGQEHAEVVDVEEQGLGKDEHDGPWKVGHGHSAQNLPGRDRRILFKNPCSDGIRVNISLLA